MSLTKHTTTVFIEELRVNASVGIYPHEKREPQEVIISLSLDVVTDREGDYLCYEELGKRIQDMLLHGHIELLETLAEMIADICLTDKRVQLVQVRLAKPMAIAKAGAVGVEITRIRGE